MTIDVLRDRITSLCVSQFDLTLAQTPFSFELQPAGEIDQVFRVESGDPEVIGGFNFSEEHTTILSVWVARKYKANPDEAYRLLQRDASSIRAAVIRDGAVTSGDYFVPPMPAGMTAERGAGREFAVIRLQVPVNYEMQIV